MSFKGRIPSSTSVADNIVAVAVQWQITFAGGR